MKARHIIILLTLIGLVASCKMYNIDGNAKKLTIGMTQEAVKSLMGSNYEAVHATQDPDTNKIYETWDYEVQYERASATYRVYFENQILVGWEKQWPEPAEYSAFDVFQ